MNAKDTMRRNLGRGLDALLGQGGAEPAETQDNGRPTAVLPVEFIQPGRFQPRKSMDPEEMESLVKSVRQNGILQPILVRPNEAQTDSYEIIAGERRWRAAQQAQLHEIPVVVKELSDSQALEIALVENLQRQDLSALEEADGYRRLMEEFNHTQEELSKALGKSRSHVANMIRLLGLPDSVKEMLDQNELTAGHARALLNADDPEGLAKQVTLRGLTVRQTEKLAQAGRDRKSAPGPKPAISRVAKSADTLALERDLSDKLGLTVTITPRGDGGELAVQYKTLEQLDDVVIRLNTRGTI